MPPISQVDSGLIVSLTDSAPYTTYPSRKLYIFLHDRYSLCMNGAEIGVLEQVHQEGFGSFLKRQNGLRLPPESFISWAHCYGYIADLCLSLALCQELGGSI